MLYLFHVVFTFCCISFLLYFLPVLFASCCIRFLVPCQLRVSAEAAAPPLPPCLNLIRSTPVISPPINIVGCTWGGGSRSQKWHVFREGVKSKDVGRKGRGKVEIQEGEKERLCWRKTERKKKRMRKEGKGNEKRGKKRKGRGKGNCSRKGQESKRTEWN